MKIRSLFAVTILVTLWHSSTAEGNDLTNFFLKASKSVPRIGRNGPTASGPGVNAAPTIGPFIKHIAKNIPRIGRETSYEKDFDIAYLRWLKDNNVSPKFVKRSDDIFRYSDISELIEYHPELLESPHISDILRTYKDPEFYDWKQTRMKRTDGENSIDAFSSILNKELSQRFNI